MNYQPYIKETITWLTGFVIEHNICPFAKREYDQNTIRYCVIDTADITESLTSLIMECLHLDSHREITTTLLILPNGFDNFDDFLDLLAFAEELLIEQGYEGVYQIASFHPDYCFQDVSPDDPANYTNRSPYPMLHVLRESSIEAALKSFPHPEKIPERNIQYTRQLGHSTLQKLLSACINTG